MPSENTMVFRAMCREQSFLVQLLMAFTFTYFPFFEWVIECRLLKWNVTGQAYVKGRLLYSGVSPKPGPDIWKALNLYFQDIQQTVSALN